MIIWRTLTPGMWRSYKTFIFIRSVLIAEVEGAAYSPFSWEWSYVVSAACEKKILL
jgi:hypothetical protein